MKKYILSILLLFVCVSAGYSLTLSEVCDQVRINVNDNPADSSRYRYSDAVLATFANTAQREIVNATWLAEKTTSYALSVNTTYYDLPSDLIAVEKVELKDTSGNIIEIEETSIRKLYSDNVEWKTQTGTPSEYYISQVGAGPSSENLTISYIPIATTLTTGTVTIQYYSTVSSVSVTTDIPFDSKSNLTSYHQAIVYHVSAQIKRIESKLTEFQTYYQLYTNEIVVMRARLGSMVNYSNSVQVAPR